MKVRAWFIVLFLSFATPAFADDAWSKLGRGLTNITFGVGEILFRQPFEMARTEPWPIAVFGGFFKGVAMFVVREVVGVYEVVTFPLPWPNHYGPIIYPEFVAGNVRN